MSINIGFHATEKLEWFDNKANRGSGTLQMQLKQGYENEITVFMTPQQAHALGEWLQKEAFEMLIPVPKPPIFDELAADEIPF